MQPVLAHVKWFSAFDFADQPVALRQVLTDAFWWLAALSLAVIALLVLVEEPARRSAMSKRLDAWLGRYRANDVIIMRVGVFATLLWAWQLGVLFAPELAEWSSGIGWAQFVVALLMLLPRTVPIGGAALIGLYALGISHFGLFHTLDYLIFAGVGYMLLVSQFASVRWRASGLPVMYATVGFCLAWLAAEKLIYPQWSLYLLDGHPELTFGIDHQFFLLACAFIEFSLGYLLMMCLFERMLAIVITVTFFSTSTVFGKTEVVGHTIIHAALLVFLVKGEGDYYRPPIRMVRSLPARLTLASVGFAVTLAAVLVPYAAQAAHQYERVAQGSRHRHDPIEVGGGDSAPTIKVTVTPDATGGWNVRLETTNFRFAPENVGGPPGEGHAHLYVDDRKGGRLYSQWHFLPPLAEGRHIIKVSLHANHHGPLLSEGRRIEASASIVQEARTSSNPD